MRPLKIPHPIAEILWLAWFANALVAIFVEWPSDLPTPFATEYGLTGVVIGSFLVLEIGALLRGRGKPWAATFSEVVWYRVPLWWARWLLGTFLALAAFAMVHRLAGFFLLVWLGSHFAFYTSRDSDGVGKTTITRDIHRDLEEARRRQREEEARRVDEE